MSRRSWAVLLGVALVAGLGRPASAQFEPTAEHKELAKIAGTWDFVTEGGPGGGKGTATYKVACNGLWVTSDFEMADGSFSGRGLDGYDSAKGKFISVWVDSMSTAPLMFEGSWDGPSKTLTMTGDGMGPDGKPAKFKSVTKHTDADHMTFELFMTTAGTEAKLMTINYTRRK